MMTVLRSGSAAPRLCYALFALITSGCLTDPDGVATVSVSPEEMHFASIRAPAQIVTVTVIGNDGKEHTDVPVTWTYWVSQAEPLSPWNSVIDIQRDGATTWRATPKGTPGGVFIYANAGGRRSKVILASVRSGPPITASIASGNGTLTGTTTIAPNSHVTTFGNLALNGLGEFTLRFTSPGLTPVVSNAITVSAP